MASLPASPPYWAENHLVKTKLADFALHLQKSAFNCVKVQNRPSFSVSGHWTKELMPWRDRNGPSSSRSHVRWYFFSLCFVSIPHLLVQGLQLSIVDLGLSSPGFIAFNICLLTQLVKQIPNDKYRNQLRSTKDLLARHIHHHASPSLVHAKVHLQTSI